MTSADLAGTSILVVEDHPLIALDLQTALQDAGADVFVARGPEEALAHLSPHRCTAAIIDHWPFSADRRALARKLRQRKVPFIYYTAQRPAESTTTRGVPYLAKPASPAHIVSALTLLLSRSR